MAKIIRNRQTRLELQKINCEKATQSNNNQAYKLTLLLLLKD